MYRLNLHWNGDEECEAKKKSNEKGEEDEAYDRSVSEDGYILSDAGNQARKSAQARGGAKMCGTNK